MDKRWHASGHNYLQQRNCLWLTAGHLPHADDRDCKHGVCASHLTNVGDYSDDMGYFAVNGVDRAPLHALADGVFGEDGVYGYNSTVHFRIRVMRVPITG